MDKREKIKQLVKEICALGMLERDIDIKHWTKKVEALNEPECEHEWKLWKQCKKCGLLRTGAEIKDEPEDKLNRMDAMEFFERYIKIQKKAESVGDKPERIEGIDYEKMGEEGKKPTGTREGIIRVAKKTDECVRAINIINKV